MNLKVRSLLLLALVILCFFPGVFPLGHVTLKSIQIFNTYEWFIAHEWFIAKPTVYFQCKGEDKIILPDVKEAHVVYTFKGEESWQPLTELPDKKCKRCGLYQMGTLKSDDIFDEWEFCSSDFIDPDGNYARFKDNDFNAKFYCPQCVHIKNSSDHASASHNLANTGKGMDVRLIVLISAMVPTVSILGVLAAYRYWPWRKREQHNAQFRKAI